MNKKTIGQLLLMTSILALGATFGGNLFDTIVNEKNTSFDYPTALIKLREVWTHSNPGNFFRTLTPFYSVSTIIALIIFWKSNKKVRLFLLLSIVGVAITQAITIIYFFPQNAIIRTGTIEEINAIKNAYLTTRQNLDSVRTILTLLSVVFSFSALHYSYQQK